MLDWPIVLTHEKKKNLEYKLYDHEMNKLSQKGKRVVERKKVEGKKHFLSVLIFVHAYMKATPQQQQLLMSICCFLKTQQW